ncbi:hypothetical protein, partial [Burkholderia contaminans]|uniref:hypothetical protein n=1 Tax=Burkholderia contaminans TaxID=488447 RepID=UPI001C2ED5ED
MKVKRMTAVTALQIDDRQSKGGWRKAASGYSRTTRPGIVKGDNPRDLSVISWAGHIMRCKGHGYADEEEK